MKSLKIYEWQWYIATFLAVTGGLGFTYDIYTELPTGLRLYFLIAMVLASIVTVALCIKNFKSYYFKYDNSKIKWLFPHMDEPKVMDIQNLSKVDGVGHIIKIQKKDGTKALFSVEHVSETAQEKIKQFFQARVK